MILCTIYHFSDRSRILSIWPSRGDDWRFQVCTQFWDRLLHSPGSRLGRGSNATCGPSYQVNNEQVLNMHSRWVELIFICLRLQKCLYPSWGGSWSQLWNDQGSLPALLHGRWRRHRFRSSVYALDPRQRSGRSYPALHRKSTGMQKRYGQSPFTTL